MKGCIGLVGDAFSLWFSFKGCTEGWGYPQQGSLRDTGISLKSFSWVDSVYLLLAVMPMRMTHWHHPPLMVVILSTHGSRGPLMTWSDSHDTSCTPDTDYNVLSRRWLTTVPSFWPNLPHQGQWVTL